MRKKIAICGAHGVGKTTLIGEVARQLQSEGINCLTLPEVPRIVCSAVSDPQFFRRGKNSVERQLLLLFGQVAVEAVHLAGEGVMLGDRSILDHWAYTRCLFGTELVNADVLSPAEQFVREYCSTYSKVFYVPIEFSPRDDGTRESDLEFQAAIDQRIRSLLDSLLPEYTTVSGNLGARTSLVVNEIRRTVGGRGGSQ